jgi:4-hydroxythreonine-4-phosphate dehydrogenase
MLAALTGVPRALMLMLSGTLRVGLATVHIPLRRVPSAITVAGLSETLRIFGRSLRADFGILRPSIAVLGLNPHAGEHGLLGNEERRVIVPAMRRVRVPGVTIEGPFPADGFFGSGAPGSYDGVLAMYHDQGLVPLKLSGFKAAVNFTAGLPIVRTSPGHGTAYDIAGRGLADPGATVESILAAASIITHRSGKGARP